MIDSTTLRRPGARAAAENAGVTVIRPTTGPIPPRLNELWRYRELFGLLVWRDIKVRYAQTALGALWMVFQPLALMLVYTFAFSHLTHVHLAVDAPYPLFALSGLVLWIFVSRGVLIGAESLVQNMALVTKTSCPRILLPTAAVVSVLADFLVTVVLFFVFAGAYEILPSWHAVFVPGILALAFILTLGLTLLLSAMSVRYRDVSQALPFLIQLWFFLSPIAYQLQTPGKGWETAVQGLNPLVGLVLAMRWSLLGGSAPHGLFVVSCLGTAVIFALGVMRFARAERTIADEL
jgi:homopolymeric O-antigen transport system permease protein